MKSDIRVFFENMSRKFKFHLYLTRITGTLHEDQCTFLIASRSDLLRMRNFSDKSCRENQNTLFMFGRFFFPKIVPRVCVRMWKNIVEPDWLQMTMAHARCILDA